MTELSYSLDSPADVLSRARAGFIEKRKIEFEDSAVAFASQSIAAPIYPVEALSKSARIAINNVRAGETLLVATYRTLVDDRGRIAQGKAQEDALRRTIEQEYSRELEQHEEDKARLNAEKESHFAKLSSEFELAVEADMLRYLSFRLGGGRTKFKETRLLRAGSLGILSMEKTFVRRLDSSVAKDTSMVIRKQDGFSCVLCHRRGPGTVLHVHHIIPLSQFGTNNERNLATVCYACHCKQHPEIDMSKISNEILI